MPGMVANRGGDRRPVLPRQTRGPLKLVQPRQRSDEAVLLELAQRCPQDFAAMVALARWILSLSSHAS